MTTSLGRLVLDIAANAAGFERDMQRVSKSAKKEMNRVSRELRFAQRDLDAARSKVTRLSGAFVALGGVGLGVVIRQVRQLSQEADRIAKLSTATGLTAESIQRLGFAAEQSGSDLETIVRGVQQLQRNIQGASDGLSTYTRAFERIGVSVQELQQLSPEDQFRRIAQAISDTENPTVRTATALEVFGRAGRELLPLLDQGTEGLDALTRQLDATGSVLSGEATQAAEVFNDALNVLGKQAGALQRQLFSDLIVPLSQVADFFANTEQGQQALRNSLERLGQTAQTVGVVIGGIFLASLTKSTVAMLAQEVRVGILTARKLQLAGASTTAATSMAIFGRAVSIATGPIGIAVTLLGGAALAFRSLKPAIDAATSSGEDFRQTVAALTDDTRELTRLSLVRGIEQGEERVRQLAKELRELGKIGFERDTGERARKLAEEIQKTKAEIVETGDGIELLKQRLAELRQPAEIAGESVEDLGVKVNFTAEGVDFFVESLNRFSADAALAFLRRASEIADSIRDMNDEIADVAATFNGPFGQSIRDFQREAQRIGELFRNQDITGEQAQVRLQQLEEQFNRTNIELRDGLIKTMFEAIDTAFPSFIAAMLDIEQATNRAGSGFGALSSIGNAFGQAIINGQSISAAFSSAFTSFGSQGIAQALEDTIAIAAENGLTAAFKSKGFQQNSAQGFALAIGQAAQGNIGQAAFTAIGNAIGGPIGSAIGSFIGSLVFRESVPKFQVRGSNANRATDAGTDFADDFGLGQVQFAFRRIPEEAQRQVIEGFSQLDRELASIFDGLGLLDEATEAARSFGVSSRADGEDLQTLLQARLDALLPVLGQEFATFIDNFGLTLQEKLQALSDIGQINNLIARGISLGLSEADISPITPISPIPPPGGGGGGGGGGINDPEPNPFIRPLSASGDIQAFQGVLNETGDTAQIVSPVLLATVQALEEVRVGSESLLETYQRTLTTLNTLDAITQRTGAQFAETRQELIRFGADFAAIFGDNAQIAAQQFQRIFDTFFTEAENAEANAAIIGDRARSLLIDLLSGIDGFEFSEEFLTQSGFRDLFDQLVNLDLSPEQLAILGEAGAAIADLIDAEEALADAREDGTESLRDAAQIADILSGLETDAIRAGLEGVDLALFDLDQTFSDLEEQLQSLGATPEELAQLEQLFADERLRIIEQFNEQAILAEQRRLDAIADIFTGLQNDAARAGLSGLELALFNLDLRFADLRDRLIELGATGEELARLEDFLAGERLRIIEQFNEQAVEAERRRLQEINDFLITVGNQALSIIAPARSEFAALARQIEENEQRARELGLSERQLQIVRLSSQIQLQQFIASLTESIASLNQRLFGANQGATEAATQIQRSVENMRDAWLQAIDDIRDALDAQLVGPNSSLTPAQQLAEAQSQFDQALAAAQAGDLAAAQALPQLFNQLLALGAGFFGTSTTDFQLLESALRAALENADLPVPPASPEQQTATNTAATASATQGIELSAFEQIALATQLIDQIGLLSQLTEQSPSEIGSQFGVPIGELIQILTGEVPDLTGDALSGFFDELVAETNATLNELAQLEAISADQLDTQNVIAEIAAAQLLELQNLGVMFGSLVSDTPAFADGGPVSNTGLATVHSGEFVVPRGGTLVSDGGQFEVLERIDQRLAVANTDRRRAAELSVEELTAVRSLIAQQARKQRTDALRPLRRASN